jgi:hypothetical protein
MPEQHHNRLFYGGLGCANDRQGLVIIMQPAGAHAGNCKRSHQQAAAIGAAARPTFSHHICSMQAI